MSQTYRSSKGDMLRPVRWVSAQMLPFLYVVIVFVVILLSFWRSAQAAIFRVHEHVHVRTCMSSPSFFLLLSSVSGLILHW